MSTIEQATTVLEAHGYSVCAEAVAELEKDRDRLLGQRQDQSVEIDALKAAITGLLKYHQDGDDGAELPREYWSPGYREAVEIAEALVGSNARVEGPTAALSRAVPSHDGLCPDGGEK